MLSRVRERIGSIRRSVVASRWPLFAVVVVAMVVTISLPAYAQVLYGTLTGNVTDETGAVTVGAKVKAVETSTNVTKNTTTDTRGAYRFADLLPGVYDVTVEAPSFKTLVQKGVKIETNAVRRVNAQLRVSPITEVVEVTFTAPALQTDRTDVHITQTAREVNDLPLAGSLGRNYQYLMQVVPGATIQRTEENSGEANSTSGSPQRAISFSANGVSGMANETRIDGSPARYIYLSTNTAYVPSAEAIEEVSIVTNSFSADQGLAGGAAVNVVIKSGTNKLHGTAWGYDTSSHFTARNVFAPPTEGMRPKNIVAQFGGNLGGPIVKDKLFFFANGERSTQRVGAGSGTFSLPPANLRPNSAGDVVFPTPTDNATYGVIIYDPNTGGGDPSKRTPFPNNTIPASRIDQAAKWFLQRMPVPSLPGYDKNVVTKGASKYNRTNWDAKVNYAASSRLSMFARYSNSPHNIIDDYALGEVGGPSVSGGQPGFSPGRTQVFGAGFTYTFSPTLMLDANVGHLRQVLGAEAADIDENLGSDPNALNIPGTNGPDRMQGGLPGFNFANGFTNLGNNNTGNPFNFNDRLYTASMNLQKTAGPHLFRLGAEYMLQQINHFQAQGGVNYTARGSFAFNGNVTALQGGTKAGRLNDWADFLLGLPTTAGRVDQIYIPNSIGWKTYAAYLSDTWQVSKALTATLGLRWELYALPFRPDGKGISRFDVDDGWVYLGGYGNTPRDTGASVSGRFMPRAGLAYRINDKTVLRAGYGRSQDNFGFQEYRNSWPTQYAYGMPTAKFNGVDNNYLPLTTLRQGIPTPAPIDISAGKLRLPAGVGTGTYPKEAKRGALDTWNIALQRELASWLTAQVAYVGTRVDGQMGFIQANAGPPGEGNAGRVLNKKGFTSGGAGITSVEPYGKLAYDGLQTELKVRSNNAQAGITYTLSKTTNYFDNTVGWATGAGSPKIQWKPEMEKNKGKAGYDRTHVFNLYGVWELPLGKGKAKAQSGIANVLFGGWQINGLLAVYSGTPIYIEQGNGYNLNAAGSGQIPDQVGPVTINKNVKVCLGGLPAGANPADYQWFNPSAFQAVNIPVGQPQRFGNAVRDDVPGPGYWNLDMGIFRTINLAGSVKLQFRAEALNALNHPNFRTPSNKAGNANDITHSNVGRFVQTTATGSRNLRFAVRLWF